MRFPPSKSVCLATVTATLAVLAAHAADSPSSKTTDATESAIHYSEVSRKTINLGDHKMTFVRVRPPVLPPPPPPPPVHKPTAEEIAAAERLAEKAYVTLNVSATVYLYGDRAITEIRWRNPETGNHDYRAWSNADFRYLTQVTDLESDTTVYSWFPFVDVWDMTSLPADERPELPANLSFSKTQVEYYLDKRAKDTKDQEETLAGLDYLHAYYQVHYPELKAYYDKLMADNAAREKELRENPPIKPDTVIRFWPIKSGVNSR